MDKISRLPDDVICHILSFLPTKHAVATSILSSRWVNLWTYLPIIDLDDSLYLDPLKQYSNSVTFINFLDRVLSQNQSHNIIKYKVHIHHSHGQSLFGLNGFIQKLVLKNVVEIDIGIFCNIDLDGDCLVIPNSDSLEVLKVRSEFCLKMPAFPGCFPRLRVFDVKVLLNESDELVTKLFPCLPVLERLCLVGDLTDCTGEVYVNVGGAALKHVELELLINNYDECDAMVVVDAPKLEYLKLKDRFLGSYLVKNKPEISEVRVDVGEYDDEFLDFLDEAGPARLTRFDDLLNSLVNAKFVSVSATTLKLIFSQRWNIPVLPYLTKLELDVYPGSWILLINWLGSCPNLTVLSLIIKEKPGGDYEEVELTGPDIVPSCLSSRVKEIEIKRLGKVEEEDMLKYLLDNARVLDKFTVNSQVYIKDGILQ